MKKIIGTFMAVFIAVSAMTGCSNEAKVDKKENPEEAVEAAVARFFDDIKDNKLGEFEDYFTEDSTDKESFDSISPETMCASLTEGLGEMSGAVGEETIDEWTNKAMDKFMGSIDYTINSVNVDGDTARVSATVTMPDGTSMDDVDIDGLMEQAFGFDINDDMQALLQKMQEKTGKSVEDIFTDINNADEDELNAYMFEIFSEEFDKFIDLFIDELISNTDSQDTTITLEKEDSGEWKIKSMD